MDNQANSQTREESLKTLSKLIEDIEYAMLTTVSPDGKLHSRPMVTRQTSSDGHLWFLTGKSSLKVFELGKDQRVNLCYAKPGDNRYVSVSGVGQVFEDKEKAKELWTPAYRAWFPKGLDDPELAVLKVSIEEAEYWDRPGSGVVHLIGLAESLVTGKPSHTVENMGHRKIGLAG